jgi:hypothetical protein
VLVATGGSVAGVLRNDAISPKHIHDGMTQMLVVGESSGREDGNRFWTDAHQTFAQHGLINVARGNEMFSDHQGGVFTLYADSHVIFLSETIELAVIDAISTRSRGEVIEQSKLE